MFSLMCPPLNRALPTGPCPRAPFSARQHRELRRSCGRAVNTICMRCAISLSPSLAVYLWHSKRIQTDHLPATEHAMSSSPSEPSDHAPNLVDRVDSYGDQVSSPAVSLAAISMVLRLFSLKYQSTHDAIQVLGRVGNIRYVFIGFQSDLCPSKPTYPRPLCV